MISVRAGKPFCPGWPRQASRLGQAALALHQSHPVGLGCPATLRAAASARLPRSRTRDFSTTRASQLRDIFPAKETGYIRQTPPAWPHPGYTQEEMESVVPAHRKPETVGDWVAWKLVRMCKWWMDLATGLKPAQKDANGATDARAVAKPLTEAQWVSGNPRRACPCQTCILV